MSDVTEQFLQDMAIREQEIRDFEWACSLNPNPFKARKQRQLRNLASDHHATVPCLMSREEMLDRQRRIEDRRKGITPMIG